MQNRLPNFTPWEHQAQASCGPGCSCLNCYNVHNTAINNSFTRFPHGHRSNIQSTRFYLDGDEDIYDIMNLMFGEWDDESSLEN